MKRNRPNPFFNWLAGVGPGILNLFYGKKFVFIGRPKTGKTWLKEFITNGEVPTEYRHSMWNKTTPYGKKFKIADCGIRVDKITDTTGNINANWEMAITPADVIFYFANAQWFQDPENHTTALENMKEDAIKMSKWRNQDPKKWNRKRIVVVVTHWDKVGHPDINHERVEEKLQIFPGYGHLEVLIASFGGRKKVPVCVVSLLAENRPATEGAVYVLLGKLTEMNI